MPFLRENITAMPSLLAAQAIRAHDNDREPAPHLLPSRSDLRPELHEEGEARACI